MKISDMGSMCFGNLFRRKTRTALTIFAVILGTTMITIMISLGLGMSLAQEEQLKQMGDLTVINVMNYGRNESGEKLVITDETVEAMQAMKGVDVATPIYNPQINISFYAGRKDRYRMTYANVIGMYASAMPKMGYELLDGEYPTGPQMNPKKPFNVVIGEYASYGFEDTKRKYNNYTWAEKNEKGEVIRDPFLDMMKTEVYITSKEPEENQPKDDKDKKVDVSREIVSVARVKENWDKGYETSGGVIMDINDVKKLEEEYRKANKIAVNKKDDTGYNRVTVKVFTMDDVDPVETQIKALGFETRSMETVRKPMQEAVRKQQMFLGMMGGITLLVAAVGIMNTMYMSIYERTREIGVMKVLGCVVSNIRSIFLMEAGVIGFLGGCIGVGISYAVSMAMNYFNFSTGLSDPTAGQGGRMMGRAMMMAGRGGAEEAATIAVSVIPPWLVIAAIVFATLIGLLSGILPASRATKISALEAIKHE